MRLLKLQPNGDFHLTDKFLDDAIPRYAILSHTWGCEEVTFEDIADGSGRDKVRDRGGYKKIEFCGNQAAGDMLQYFWIDSCCIKKSSDSELSESLNSMFRWLQRAAKCYVYLSDVSTGKRKGRDGDSQDTWAQAFRESRWFTRGWTIQELLAPTSVEFFSKEGSRLGDKQSLEQEIHKITGIPISALRGTAVSQFSVDQKFDWAKGRQTTRDEDWAYSLLGIFEISMPVIYGEGRTNAVRRLKKEIEDASKDKECLRHLYVTDPRADKTRIEETKGGLIADSYHWIIENCDFRQWRNDQQSHLLWIKGDPGKGKTMLLCGIIDELKMSMDETHVLSYFFCQATDSRINNATAVLRGLLYLLLEEQPSLILHVRKQHDYAGEGLFTDANAWVFLSEIFTSVLQDPSLKKAYFIIDALDECLADLPKLLDFIIRKSPLSSRVKWLVSSRNWPLIEGQLDRAESRVTLRLELNADSVSAAVNFYIRHKVCQLAQEKKYDDKTRDAVLDHFSLNANHTFLWVALAYQNLQKVKPWNVLTKLKEFPPGLHSLYQRMMEQIDTSNDADLCKRILASIAIVYRPVTLKELTSLVDMPESITQNLQWLAEIIALSGSFLTIREDIIYFVHQSAKDYLFAEAFNSIFPSGKEETHYEIFSRSLEVISRTLRRDIYGLGSLGCPIESVKQPNPDPLIALRYSCLHWVDHLCDWNFDHQLAQPVDLEDGGRVDVFVRKKLLYWLEALSLCRSMSKGVLSMGKLEAFIRGRTNAPTLLNLARDAHRFIVYHKQTIEVSPLQTYVSALLFSPARSLIGCLFKQEEPNWITIKPAMEDKWNACLQTLEGHNGQILSVASSRTSARLASGSMDETARIWNASNGDCLQILRGHKGEVFSVDFSHDSTRLASGSEDTTVQIWNTISGERLQILKGHKGSVRSVAFSNDSVWLASSSEDRKIKIWEPISGDCLMTLRGHEDCVKAVTFSYDSTKLASGSNDKTVKLWDLSSGECLMTLRSHRDGVCTVAFSHNSTLLASGSTDTTIIIWDTNSGEHLRMFEGHIRSVRCVAYSHDSRWLVSSSDDMTVKLWDMCSGNCLQTLRGHNGVVRSATFIDNFELLATASSDYTVKIWDINPSEYMQVFEGHTDSVSFVAFSYDSNCLASASQDLTVRIWDTRSGQCLKTLEGHGDYVRWVAFSYDSTRLASSSYDNTAKIWDLHSGDCLQTFETSISGFRPVTFSLDSARLASVWQNRTVKIWETHSGQCLQTLEGHSDEVMSIAFSHHSTLLATASNDGTVRVWDTSSGACLQMLDHSGLVLSVALSCDPTRLALALSDGTVEIWDTGNGACVQTLDIRTVLYSISFNATGSYLLTDIGAIVIDASLDADVTPNARERQDPRYKGVALSPDNAWITYDSERLVWLPSEYRPQCSAVSGRTIGFGLGSSKVWMCYIQSAQSQYG